MTIKTKDIEDRVNLCTINNYSAVMTTALNPQHYVKNEGMKNLNSLVRFNFKNIYIDV